MVRPSKRIFALTIVCISAIIFAIALNKYQSHTTSVSVKETSRLVSVQEEKDTDTDGVADWEEVLYGLDPTKAVSNPEKISDAEYIKKKKTEASLSESVPPSLLSASSTANLNPTEKLARETFSEYISLKQSNAVTSLNINSATDNITSNNLYALEDAYNISQVNVIPDSDLAGAKIYGNAFARIRTKYVNQYLENPIGSELFSESSVTSDNFQQRLNKISNIYSSLARELSQLKVPASLIEIHLKLINNYAKSANAFKIISNLSEDPLSAMFAVSEHTNAEAEESSLLSSIRQFLSSGGIIFDSNEPGIFWTQ